jgi:tRNA (guanine6-N2)-methyltransferase
MLRPCAIILQSIDGRGRPPCRPQNASRIGVVEIKTSKRRPPRKSPLPHRNERPAEIVLPSHECEVETAEGLEGMAWRELKTLFGERIEKIETPPKAGVLRFRYTGNLYHLLKLQTVQAAYLIQQFPIPRPKALLGDQHFKALLAQIAAVRELSPADAYHTLYISAAGSESSVMNRLKDELTAKTSLSLGDTEGDLLIRLRHPPGTDEGWETSVRISPRPLATRAWRVCNWEGALNATVAYVMALYTNPQPDDVFLNMLCGSGTLLIERLAFCPAKSAVGYDYNPTALECARKNVEAAGYGDQIKLNPGDARELPISEKSVDAICADLPFGNLVGSHEDNLTLYPALLKEAARVAKPGARGVFITHEVNLMDAILEQSRYWKTAQVIRISLGGLHPRIFVLERQS